MVKKKKDSESSTKGKKKIIRKLSKKIKILKEGSDRGKTEFEGAFGDLPEKEGEWDSDEQEAAAVGLKPSKKVSLEEAANDVAAGKEAIRIDSEEDSDKNYTSGGDKQIDYARSSEGGGEYVRSSGNTGGEYVQSSGESSGGEYQVSGGDSGGEGNRSYEVKDDRNYSTIDNKEKEKKEKDRLKRPWEI